MARRLRLESEAGVYHVLNRGNYRTPIFRGIGAKEAFLRCLRETCERTAWRVHAWCLMSNHYHLAVSTPRANLVDGMKWLSGTFAGRFNGLRRERGHIFQGRYKSLIVDPGEGLGPLCHYIHLNPVRAGLCRPEDLPGYRWTSLCWLRTPETRPGWYDPKPVLSHAGDLTDEPNGHKQYAAYLEWLAEDEPARKRQHFADMSTGWIVGSATFTQELVREARELAGQGPRLAHELQEAREAIWQGELNRLLKLLGRSAGELGSATPYAEWKVALAAALKGRTTVTNPWLSEYLSMGNRHHVGRRVAAWLRRPDSDLAARLQIPAQRTA